jgi:hypothetical protein
MLHMDSRNRSRIVKLKVRSAGRSPVWAKHKICPISRERDLMASSVMPQVETGGPNSYNLLSWSRMTGVIVGNTHGWVILQNTNSNLRRKLDQIVKPHIFWKREWGRFQWRSVGLLNHSGSKVPLVRARGSIPVSGIEVVHLEDPRNGETQRSLWHRPPLWTPNHPPS